ncbi:deoxyguanosinetriphosphate triphosphohydrolase [Ruminiclostridium papyrosolvens DSM 2782]|uniref:Deoxyguanosinetriphosphate triphosphohydrolase-like protein n=1 Tax=Ruminiclostridium papyrosolvens DSM 2782 TaxID=588581 RepID=F1TES9_9FIRM|nr:dNTP triphosphohydrolase [Ruminiclostridium papyrosolvens]EGD47245.1 deoxyguanosinetriphosphate triphosphohydrolase [Ruminiclostridium papyrosolvens DSM 2782]WES36284.1 dNTP triphosphohydrolase [Ruminiclostridium papyrosolvens DSM 2782]
MVKINGLELPRNRGLIEDSYATILAPFAVVKPKEDSREHEDKLPENENRGSFQRDRDRIIHSKAFRRLMYKTQVFVNHEGDHFRTRLTHTLEVAQFARGISKSLALNEDLAEAIALGHDLGHTPFGHAVERFLDEELKTREMGRFYHNEQSVRVVDFIERRSDDYFGLNLTSEVREGILKHNTDSSGIYKSLNPRKPCFSLEGQVVQLVDTVAYLCHDLQDGIESGLIENAISKNVDFKRDIDEIVAIINDLLVSENKEIGVTKYSNTYFIDSLIHKLIMSVTEQSVENLAAKKIQTLEDVKSLAVKGESLITLRKDDEDRFEKLKSLIYKSVYGIHTIQTMDSKAVTVVKDLFETFVNNPRLLPPEELNKYMHIEELPNYSGFTNNEIHVICDYIAGMTDRFALEEHERIRNPHIKI